MYEQGKILHQGQEEEIMGILLGSSLFADMTRAEREKLLHYLVASYYQPRPGQYCRAHLRPIRPVPEM